MTAAEPGRLPGTHAGVGCTGRLAVIRLGPGEDLLPAMERLIRDEGLGPGAIVSGVASLHHATVRNIHRYPEEWPIGPDDRRITTVPGPLEVLAMQGNFVPDENGGVVIHCHMAFSAGSPPGVTYGGHLVEGTVVATTCELFLAEVAGLAVRRAVDEVTKAAEIQVLS